MSEIITQGKGSHSGFIIDFAGILGILPHRYPFLLVDGIVSLEKEKSIVGQKNVSFNEPFFAGHFPSEPVMPGVLQIEALAQVSCILVMVSFPEEAAGKRPAFAGIDEAKFRKPVRPGDILMLHAELEKFRKGFALLKAWGEVNGNKVVEASIKASMV